MSDPRPQPGAAVPPGVARPHPRAGLVLGLGVASLLCFGPVTGVPAIVVGRRVVCEVEWSRGSVSGGGQARAGVVTGIIGSMLWLLAVLLVVTVTVLNLSGAPGGA